MIGEMVELESRDIIVEHCQEDRISHLPIDMIECIMEFLPIRDAARTCVLSSEWRHVWAGNPSLVLDWCFLREIRHDRSPDKFSIDYANIVSKIMLCHVGNIRRFVICISDMCSLLQSNIDLWLSSLCPRGLKELSIESSRENIYQVPCCVFSTFTLTHLSLSYCNIESKGSSVCFANIQSLILCNVTLDFSVLDTPLLTSLTLEQCSLSHDFQIYAPRLASLTIKNDGYFNLKPFMTCTSIDYVYLYSFPQQYCSTQNTGYFVDSESLNLVKLLATWPRISELEVESTYFPYLDTGSICIPCNRQLNNLRYLTLHQFNLNLGLIFTWILCILQNSPLVHTLEIMFNWEQVNDVVEPIITDFRMEQLRIVKLNFFSASRNEVLFAETILRCAPALDKMVVVDEEYFWSAGQRIHVLERMLVLQRAFPKVEIILEPYLETMD